MNGPDYPLHHSTNERWYDRIWAAYIFFTRLPLGHLRQPPRACYDSVVEWWPLTGWLTGAVMAAVLYYGSLVLPYSIAVVGAIGARMLLTGALHEDGLADFFDGFGGGGTDRQRILDIMKNSRIGTYGVLALVVYVVLLFLVLASLPPFMAALTVLAADPYAKMLSAQMVQMLPHAADTEKACIAFRRMSTTSAVLLGVQGLLPIGLYLLYFKDMLDWQYIVFLPCLTMYFLYRLVWSRLKGYTGKCCSALFLLTELTVYLTVVAVAYSK